MLTLLVSTTTIEQTFLIRNVTKVDICNKMEDTFFVSAMMLFIKRDIAATFSTDSIINDFEDLKKCRVSFS